MSYKHHLESSEASRFPYLVGRHGPVGEQMAAERELLGQLLTFCAFLGGLSLAALIALFEVMRPAVLAGASAPVAQPAVSFAQVLLGVTSVAALTGAFFALLGFLNHNQLLERLAKVRHCTHLDERTEATVRSMVGKYANSMIFRQMARFLAVVAMAAALIGVILVSYLVTEWMALALLVLSGLLLVAPIFAAQALKLRLARVPLTHWLPNTEAAEPGADMGESGTGADYGGPAEVGAGAAAASGPHGDSGRRD